MTVQPIRLFGDPVLRAAAEPVVDFDKELRTLVADLFDTMREASGAGLAAPQIGVGLRVFTYRVGEDEQGHLVNPVLAFPDDEHQDGPEGCLSIPGFRFDCRRHRHVVATGVSMYGDPVTLAGSDLLARCVQHETDHLDGVLFVDRLDPQTKQAAIQAICEAQWAGGPVPTVKPSPHPMMGRPL